MLLVALVLALTIGVSFDDPSAPGPQFVEQPGLLPGPTVWTESVVVLDANDDGLLDLLFVNCDGWSRPGDMQADGDAPLPPTLLIQTKRSGGLPQFEDRTAMLFPEGFAVHGKDAAVADLTGDGREEIVFAAAFGTQQRLLRRGDDGRYLDESDRLGELNLNAHGLGVGDLDDDGDLDLVFPDAGPRSFRAPGGKARLLLNDGKGRFTDASERLGATEKVGAQNPKILDIDGDLDLDIVLDGKSAETQVYLNDGSARFTLRTDLIPKAKGRPYEIEWGDLDGDGDLDAVHMNFTGQGRRTYSNAPLRNQLVETGTLSFEAFPDGLEGNNSQDQNDLVLYDVDDDGDLDLIVAALPAPPGPEKLFINAGKFAPGFLVQRKGAFTPFDDSTLDADIADFDGDGRLDLVTVQGESRRNEDFRNRYYRNTGPTDSRAPNVGKITSIGKATAARFASGIPVRVWIQDSSFDDGVSFASAQLLWRAVGSESEPKPIPMRHVGGGIHRAMLREEGLEAGASVEYWIEAADPIGNAVRSSVQEATVVGGVAL